ncbi:hypothetical protein [Krasilnikoviella flava]|uniref:Uncharacterized protein n=1 Tax=Krasilnikoviella flava TaxID=526729 RepID=A0A1T5LQ12_9MICO|nr:hypothetical protein [Krasilnikoviella flava]SKC78001.1 hypothetical protein SAMN04324258_3712 [Krasilnikoviella flava]
MFPPENLLLVQAIQRERLEDAERRRTIHRLQQQRKLRPQPHARRQRTSIARWLYDWLTA